MALSRRNGSRFQASIWPGFVDAMTGLLLVLMFVLTIFMVVQFVLRETISGQETELDTLSVEVAALAEALSLEQGRSQGLEERVGQLTVTLGQAQTLQQEQASLIDTLWAERASQDQALAQAQTRITSFEQQVAGLLADQEKSLGQIADLEGERDTLMSEQDALKLAFASLRDEVDAQTEAARLAASQRDVLDELVKDLRQRNAEAQNTQATLDQKVSDLESQLSDQEIARLAEITAAEALREKLKNSDTELTAMTLALEEQRRKAEETLTLLAAAQDVGNDLNSQLAAALLQRDEAQADLSGLDGLQAELKTTQEELARALAQKEAAEGIALDTDDVRAQLITALTAKLAAEEAEAKALSAAEERALLLSQARDQLSDQEKISTEAQRQQALLNQQVAALRTQLSGLQSLLDDAKTREAASDVQLQSLGKELNTALARVAAEERKRRVLEEEKSLLLEEENANLARYRSEFFGRLRDVLGNQEGVRIEGDRFVFSSEVLFAPGQATLSGEGRQEIAKVAAILSNVAGDIPDGIDWVIRVDGHTDNVPIRGNARFADNWELSQARALSVVRYMVDFLGLPPDRLSANGFGEYQPVSLADTPEARAQNRRIELKFTEK